MRLFHARLSTYRIRNGMGIKQRSLPQLVTGHVKWLYLWAHKKLW
jgi:hypothetical protein